MKPIDLSNPHRTLFVSLKSWHKPMILALWMLLSMTTLMNSAHAQTSQMRQHQRQPVSTCMFHLRDHGQQPLEFGIR